ncbi:hypothetical protein LR48_Vigan10g148200 [Vigna angularis]|uniref:Uncharacterized protein n=1 Tax=Phaseolus angularis TaxID=3914 RepID=A0A0L9VKL5_PHAAN|nr:hypothetical protein LR48_Vigan10g148200 [Vigna angularis]
MWKKSLDEVLWGNGASSDSLHQWKEARGGFRVNLVKEVKKERDEIRKDTKKCKKEKPQVPLSGSLPLSGTQELTGGPLRGKMAAEGKNRADALTAER